MGYVIEHNTNKRVSIETRMESVILHYDSDASEYFNHIEIHYEDLNDFLEILLEHTKQERDNWSK